MPSSHLTPSKKFAKSHVPSGRHVAAMHLGDPTHFGAWTQPASGSQRSTVHGSWSSQSTGFPSQRPPPPMAWMVPPIEAYSVPSLPIAYRPGTHSVEFGTAGSEVRSSHFKTPPASTAAMAPAEALYTVPWASTIDQMLPVLACHTTDPSRSMRTRPAPSPA